MASVLKNLLNKKSKDDQPINKDSSDDDSSVEAKEMKADPKVQKKVDDKSSEESSDDHAESQVINIDPENDLRAFKDPDPASKDWKNRQRTLVVCSRGIAGRMRHLV